MRIHSIRLCIALLASVGVTSSFAQTPGTLPADIESLAGSASVSMNDGLAAIDRLDTWQRAQNHPSEAEIDRYVTLRNILFLKAERSRLQSQQEVPPLSVGDALSISRTGAPPPKTGWQGDQERTVEDLRAAQLRLINTVLDKAASNKNLLREKVMLTIADLELALGGQARSTLNSPDLKALSEMHTFSKSMSGFGSLFGTTRIVPYGRFGGSLAETRRERDEQTRERERAHELRELAARLKREEDRSPPRARIGISHPQAQKNYFDAAQFPRQAQFLRQLGITRAGSHPICRDLSQLYPEPELQGQSHACAAFAAAADLMYEFNKSRPGLFKMKSVDVDYIYARMLHEDMQDADPENRIPPEMRQELRAGLWGPDEGIANVRAALSTLGGLNHCQGEGIPGKQLTFALANFGKLAAHEYGIDSFASLVPEDESKRLDINADFIRTLIDHGRPPIVITDCDGRAAIEDWLIQRNCRMEHAVNVVGYCEGIDPFDMKRKPYFIIRDSLAKKPIHYKVDAEEFVKHVLEVHKITKVKEF